MNSQELWELKRTFMPARPKRGAHHPNCKSNFNPPLSCNCIPQRSEREARERIGTLREEKGDRELVEQEWTPDKVREIANAKPGDGARLIADAHNAALAAAAAKSEEPRCDFVSHMNLENALAAEREKAKR